jgi:hypothetical protein
VQIDNEPFRLMPMQTSRNNIDLFQELYLNATSTAQSIAYTLESHGNSFIITFTTIKTKYATTGINGCSLNFMHMQGTLHFS